MRILVTGVTGQVGGALVEALRPLGTVIPVDRAQLDLSRPDGIAAALDTFAPDLIINPAAYTSVDRAEDEREVAFRINAEAPGAIARWAAGHRGVAGAAPRRSGPAEMRMGDGVPLIHFSTDYVFDGSGTRPWREDDPTEPLSVYGASKRAGEEAVRAAGGPHLIIRTSWVYAATGANFLRTIARLARERTELRIVADQFGAPTSARLIAGTVARIIAGSGRECRGSDSSRGDASASPDVAIRADGSRGGAPLAERFTAVSGCVNIAAAGETSWHGFASAIVGGLRARGISLPVERIMPIATADYPTKARRPANSRFDLTRLSRIFGVEPPTWEKALSPELDRLARELAGSAA
jgi:dTDP-4-dehydrorhamnose reductase